MRHAFVLLTLASLNACTPWWVTPEGLALVFPDFPPPVWFHVQGTVTAADDGSPIAGARVKVEGTCRERCIGIFAATTTDDLGRYSVSFLERRKCAEEDFYLEASTEGFLLQDLWYFSDPHFRCTTDMQTIDFQLDREAT